MAAVVLLALATALCAPGAAGARGDVPAGVQAQGTRVRSMTEGAEPPGLDGKAYRLLEGAWRQDWIRTRAAGGDAATLVLEPDGALRLDDSIATRTLFGDVQIHVEFRIPSQRDGSSISHGELGLPEGSRIVMSDSMNRPQRTNSCGAILDVAAPTAAASLPPGGWQTLDIAYRAPRAAPDGQISEPARVTVLHNGVLVHNGVALPSGAERRALRGPIELAKRSGVLHVRNLWVRALDISPPGGARAEAPRAKAEDALASPAPAGAPPASPAPADPAPGDTAPAADPARPAQRPPNSAAPAPPGESACAVGAVPGTDRAGHSTRTTPAPP
jgi:hypothetical protein